MNAVIYLRVSTKEQAEEGYSIAAQREACARYVAEHGGVLIEEFVDRGESARTADRPEFQRMLQHIKDDESISHLVVHKLDRLARNTADHVAVRAALKKANVQLVSVTETLEDNASGQLVEGIIVSINQFYSANLSQEIRKGQKQKAAEGGWPTHAPYGYRNVRRDTGTRRGEAVLEPDEQAHLVVLAFEQYANGEHTVPSLQKLLTKKGFRNNRGGPITTSGVHSMLRNPVYAGTVRWNGIDYQGKHEALISRDLYEKVQQVLDAHSSGGERSWKHDHYLKGTLYCAECGSRLYFLVAKKGRFGYFRCVGRNTRRKPCSQTVYIPVHRLEGEVERLYGGLKLPPELEEDVRRVLEAEITEREAHRAESAMFLSRRLKTLTTEKEKLLRAYYAEAIDVETLKREQVRIREETLVLEGQLSGETTKLQQARELIELALRLAKDCHASYQKASPETRRLWNRAFFNKIMIKDGKVVGSIYEEPFSSVLGSHKGSLVEKAGHYSNQMDELFEWVEALLSA